MDASRIWQDTSTPTPVWGEIRDFVAGCEARDAWWSRVQLRDGTKLICKVSAIQNGATMVSFRTPETNVLPTDQERFPAISQG
jgi:hypothetical protein